MKKKSSLLLCALIAVCIPAIAVFSSVDISATLAKLRRELQNDYRQLSHTRNELIEDYEKQHQKMVDIIKQSNDLSLMLYSQKEDYTFDLSFALQRVTEEYEDFNRDKKPYDFIISNLNIEIDRYARLIESLRRLPPELKEVEVIPEDLAYHNDSLDWHLMNNESLLEQVAEEEFNAMAEAIALAVAEQQVAVEEGQSNQDEEIAPSFVLDQVGQENRDTCLFYASELLKMYAGMRETVMVDSTHYKEAYLRLKESYDYARDYYKFLEQKVFIKGQTPWFTILSDFGEYWDDTKTALRMKYNASFFNRLAGKGEEPGDEQDPLQFVRFDYGASMLSLILFFILFFFLWGLSALVLMPVMRFVKPLKRLIPKETRRYLVLLVTCLLFLMGGSESDNDFIIGQATQLAGTFVWLLAAITTALLLRLKTDHLKNGFKHYLPTIFTALFVISCRVLFLPNALLNLLLPPLLFVMVIWQLIVSLTDGHKSAKADSTIGWISLGVTAIAMIISVSGYIFMSLLILVWWYFQLAFILSIVTVWHLLAWYKERRMTSRINEYRKRITYVAGPDKEKLLFGITWFYDLVRNVVIPVMAIVSIPLCLNMALDVFEFDDLYNTIFKEPFLQVPGKDGVDGFCVSVYSLLSLAGLYFLFKYLDRAIHTVWQYSRFQSFLRKYKKKYIRNNEINLSLGNSIISVLLWFTYIVIIVVTLQIPTGSLGLIIGGLSAGIGLALKDILNNFIYGIQLMGGRLRVGDWIECDGIRGKVTDINYQSTLVETLNGTQVAFLNASLFSKNFTNLTRNNSYEFTKITVGVAYGTNVQHVREVLEKALEVMKTKDSYGRDVVDPANGIYVRFDDFGDSSVNVAVKQYVLVAERVAYVDKAKEVIYEALNEAGITIPFPQCDLHIIADEA